MTKKERNKAVRLAALRRRRLNKAAATLDGGRVIEILDALRRVERRAA